MQLPSEPGGQGVCEMDKPDIRRSLAGFATGVAVVATRDPALGAVGLTVNSFSSVSLEPPLVLWCLRQNSRLLNAFVRGGMFSVSALSEQQMEPCAHFAAREPGRRGDAYFENGAHGVPVLRQANAWLVCRARRHFDEGDHVVFIGEVLDAFVRPEPVHPLVFFGSRFHRAVTMA
jgi:flavin reductase (DIM6/NTAB) family NADH-FMN oxidoreductase RutF